MDEEIINEAEIEESTSPVPVEEVVETMSFGEALIQAVSGKRIRRQAWPEGEYGFFKNDLLAIFKDGREFDSWSVSKGDVIESDYEVF